MWLSGNWKLSVFSADGDVCHLPKDERECEEMVVKWHYNPAEKICERFWYGGCDDTGNQFDSQADCEKMCHPQGTRGLPSQEQTDDAAGDHYRQYPEDRPNPDYPETRVEILPESNQPYPDTEGDSGPQPDNTDSHHALAKGEIFGGFYARAF